MSYTIANPNELYHHGVLGMKWGVRRYQPYGSGGYNPKNKGEFRPDKKESSGEKTTSEKAKVVSSGSVFEERNKKQDELYKQFTKDVSKFDDIKPKDDEWFDPETDKITKKAVNYLNKLDPIEKEWRKKDKEIWNEYLDKYHESVKDFVTSEEVKPRMDKIMEAQKEIDEIASETIYNLDDTDPNYYDNFSAAEKEYTSKTKKLRKTIRSEKDSIIDEYCKNDDEKLQMEMAIDNALFYYDDWTKEMKHSDTKERTMYAITNDELYHHGVLGMKWGVRRYQPYGVGYDADHKGKFVGERKNTKTRSDRDPKANRSSINGRSGSALNARSVEKLKKKSNANKGEVTIDVTGAKTKGEIHDRVQKSVNTPDYYGRNLDALNDVLTEQGVKKVNIKGADKTEGEAKEYTKKMQKLADDLQNDGKADKRSPEHKAEIDANEAARREELKKYVHGDQFDMNKLYDDANNNVKECEKAIDDISKFGTKSKAYQNSEYKQEIEDLCDEYEKYAGIKIDENAKAEIMLEYLKYELQDYKDLKDWANEGLADEDKITPQKVMQQIHNKYNKKADEINKKYSVKHSDLRGWVIADELYHHGLETKWGVRKYQPYVKKIKDKYSR